MTSLPRPSVVRRLYVAAITLAFLSAAAGCKRSQTSHPRLVTLQQTGADCPFDEENGHIINGFVPDDVTFRRIFVGWHRDPARAHAPMTQCIRFGQINPHAVLDIEWHHVSHIAEALGHPDPHALNLAMNEHMHVPGEGASEHVFELPRFVVDGIARVTDAELPALVASVTAIVRSDAQGIGSEFMRNHVLSLETETRWMQALQALSRLSRAASRPDQHVYVYRFE